MNTIILKKKPLITGVLSFVLIGLCGWLWTKTDRYQIGRVIAEAPIAEAANSPEGQEAIKAWSFTLASLGYMTEAQSAVANIADARQHVPGLASIAAGLERDGQPDAAKKLIVELTERANKIADDDLRFQSLAEACLQLYIGSAGSAGESLFEVALSAANKISDLNIRSTVLSKTAQAFANAEAHQYSNRLFDGSLTSARDISSLDAKCSRLDEIAMSMANVKLNDRAKDVYNEALDCAAGIKGEDARTTGYKSIATSAIVSGNGEVVLKAARKLPIEQRLLIYFLAPTVVLARGDNYKSAAEIAEQMPIYSLRHLLMRMIIDALVEEGKLNESLSLARSMKSKSDRADLLFEILYSLETVDSEKVERKRFGEILAELKTIEPATGRSKVLSHISDGQQGAANVDAALSEIEKISDPSLRTTLLEVLARKALAAGRVKSLMAVIEKLPKENKPVALSDLAVSLAAHGQADRAIETARQIEDEKKKREALKKVAIELGRIGKADEAARAARLVQEPSEERWRLWQETAQGVVKTGKIIEAVKLAKNIPDAEIRASTIAKLIGELTIKNKSGTDPKYSEPVEIARLIESETNESLVMATLGAVYGVENRFADARRVTERCTPPHRLMAYSSILINAKSAGDPEAEKRLKLITYPWSPAEPDKSEIKETSN